MIISYGDIYFTLNIIEKEKFNEFSKNYYMFYTGLDLFVNRDQARGEVTFDDDKIFEIIENKNIYTFAPDVYLWKNAEPKHLDVYKEFPEYYNKCYLFFNEEKDYIKWKLSN